MAFPRRVRYECPKCKRRESYIESDCISGVPRMCYKCKVPLVVKDTSLNRNPTPKDILDVFLNLFK